MIRLLLLLLFFFDVCSMIDGLARPDTVFQEGRSSGEKKTYPPSPASEEEG